MEAPWMGWSSSVNQGVESGLLWGSMVRPPLHAIYSTLLLYHFESWTDSLEMTEEKQMNILRPRAVSFPGDVPQQPAWGHYYHRQLRLPFKGKSQLLGSWNVKILAKKKKRLTVVLFSGLGPLPIINMPLWKSLGQSGKWKIPLSGKSWKEPNTVCSGGIHMPHPSALSVFPLVRIHSCSVFRSQFANSFPLGGTSPKTSSWVHYPTIVCSQAHRILPPATKQGQNELYGYLYDHLLAMLPHLAAPFGCSHCNQWLPHLVVSNYQMGFRTISQMLSSMLSVGLQ